MVPPTMVGVLGLAYIPVPLLLKGGNQEESDQTTDTCFVEEQEEVNSSNEPIPHKDKSSAPSREVKMVTTSQNRESNKPSREEIKEVESELRSLRINAEDDGVKSTMFKHWRNVQNALARVKEGIAQGWCSNPTGLFINSCKNGTKPEKSTAVAIGFNEWFAWARKQRIALASTTIDGVHCVMLDDRWIPTAKAMEMYPNASASPKEME